MGFSVQHQFKNQRGKIPKNYNGKLNTITYGNGFTESYVYDKLDRISEICYNGVTKYKYSYDTNGNLYKIVDIPSNIVTIYKYDTRNRVVSAIEYDATEYEANFEMRQGYDDQSRLEFVNYTLDYGISGSKVKHSYEYKFTDDSASNLSSLSIRWLTNVSASINYSHNDCLRRFFKIKNISPPH